MIGITGGIASGKSTVAKYLRSLGAVVLDADSIAREVVEPGTYGWQRVREEFPQVIGATGEIDRAKLGRIVFEDPAKRKQLEAIVHPLVLNSLQESAKKEKEKGSLLFAEVPLLYEVGWETGLQSVWVVYVDYKVQLERLLKRSGLPLRQVEQMIASQMPLAEKAKKADVVIDNNGTQAETFAQVDALWKELRSEDSTNRP